MIRPHGSDKLNPLYVADPAKNAALAKEALGLPSILISSAAAGNAAMLGAGYFNPLTGYMNKADAISVAEKLHTTSGLFWPTPVLNLVNDAGKIKAGDRIALKDPNVAGNPIMAVMDVKAVETFSDAEKTKICEKVYRTTDAAHAHTHAKEHLVHVGNRLHRLLSNVAITPHCFLCPRCGTRGPFPAASRLHTHMRRSTSRQHANRRLHSIHLLLSLPRAPLFFFSDECRCT